MTTTTCPDCAQAQTSKHWGGFRAHCKGCTVRALATGPAFWESRCASQITPGYRAALVSAFGEDGVQAGHQAVKTEYERNQAMKSTGS
ncbi:hypothetical protein AVME950_02330 [Acidovorax sp. SUPP950]|uniref:hypothetical protein n=1 Tax=Acidovorax sp. SUPP950 TaxID=511901 RepID=UPI0023C1BB37|nr:hypothetical protein [Acidovorax sp. SUPP950]GKS73684.1 hypothetical protein AVME950_02330 [Acidovorax sp. SUPP950]